MKNNFVTIALLMLLSFSVHAQIQVEEAKPKTSYSSSYDVPFDSTQNKKVIGTDISSYIGKELFFLARGGEFFSDSLAEHTLYIQPQLKYYIFLDRVYVPSREYYDSYRQDIIEVKSKFLYKLKEKGTDNIVWYYPELDNPLMPGENAFSAFDVIWVSHYNYLKTEYIGRKYAMTHNSAFVSPFADYITGEKVAYKYNDIWTVEDVKVIKSESLFGGDLYVLRLALKNNSGNVITVFPSSNLLVDKKTYDEYVKLYGATMVKSAFEGDLKVGMHQKLVYHITKHYRKGNNLSTAKTPKGEDWTIRTSSKTLYISFNTAGKVTSWKEEDAQDVKIKAKVSVTPR